MGWVIIIFRKFNINTQVQYFYLWKESEIVKKGSSFLSPQ